MDKVFLKLTEESVCVLVDEQNMLGSFLLSIMYKKKIILCFSIGKRRTNEGIRVWKMEYVRAFVPAGERNWRPAKKSKILNNGKWNLVEDFKNIEQEIEKRIVKYPFEE